MRCPKCGAPNASYVDRDGRSRNQRRRKGFLSRKKKQSLEDYNKNISGERIKCKKCGVFEEWAERKNIMQ